MHSPPHRPFFDFLLFFFILVFFNVVERTRYNKHANELKKGNYTLLPYVVLFSPTRPPFSYVHRLTILSLEIVVVLRMIINESGEIIS